MPVVDTLSPQEAHTAQRMDIRKLQRAIVDGLEDVKAQNIVVFNTEALSPLFERVIIASGTSNRQTKALAASVRDAVKAIGEPAPRTEGEENGEWIIVDCGAAVAHIMQPAIRDYYHLEEIWGVKPVQLKAAVAKARAGLPKAEEPAAKTPARKAAAKKAAGTAAGKSAGRTAAKTAAKAAPKPASKTASKTTAVKTAAAKRPASRTATAAPAKPAAKKAAPAKTPTKAPTKAAVKTTAVKKATRAPAKAAPAPAAEQPRAPRRTAKRTLS
jgi:ribosome-associated protein